MMKILLSGPAGSGKTTQAKILAEKFGLCFVSGGDLAREKALEETPEGREVKEALEKGELIDDRLEAQLVKGKIVGENCSQGFVLDGYPRSLNQLGWFDPNFDHVFVLEISDEEAEKRLIARGRDDDKSEVIRERLAVYHELTEPVLDYYRQKGRVEILNGQKGIKDVACELEERLRKEA